ncbi:hypothetical protein EIP91_001539 [Steccherinum ochraceum]|uniref:Uncharacterized protein n=1 Tax=Steccherinum ochraceum TaxID=92696 RepID=A0A4R0S124_9APHY|nr:hypothetical protein EIP91_001539 [Steccherinum ochraceum]
MSHQPAASSSALPSITHIVTNVQQSSNAPLTPPGDAQNKQPRPRLPPAGLKILRGCGYYNTDKLKIYFAGARQNDNKKRRESGKEAKPTLSRQPTMSKSLCNKLYPSFTHPATLKHLYELLDMFKDPDSGLLEVWADRLGVEVNDVKSWWDLECRRERKPNVEELDAAAARQQLPTPQPTASPEPPQRGEPYNRLQRCANIITGPQLQQQLGPEVQTPDSPLFSPVKNIDEFCTQYDKQEAELAACFKQLENYLKS